MKKSPKNLHIKVVLDTQGAAPPGVNRDALIEDIQAELDKIAKKESASLPKPTLKPAPPGAQGDLPTIQWVLDLLTDPAMAKTYATILIHTINELLRAAGSKNSRPGDMLSKTQEKRQQKTDKWVRITILGKEIALPAATALIEKFLKKMGED